MTIYITVCGNTAEISLEENQATEALRERLSQGDVTYTADDYGGFEKVGALGFSLPHADTHITTQPGDVVLYQGNQIVLFYGNNSWAYTRLGKIEGLSQRELGEFMCAGRGSVQVALSLNN